MIFSEKSGSHEVWSMGDSYHSVRRGRPGRGDPHRDDDGAERSGPRGSRRSATGRAATTSAGGSRRNWSILMKSLATGASNMDSRSSDGASRAMWTRRGRSEDGRRGRKAARAAPSDGPRLDPHATPTRRRETPASLPKGGRLGDCVDRCIHGGEVGPAERLLLCSTASDLTHVDVQPVVEHEGASIEAMPETMRENGGGDGASSSRPPSPPSLSTAWPRPSTGRWSLRMSFCCEEGQRPGTRRGGVAESHPARRRLLGECDGPEWRRSSSRCFGRRGTRWNAVSPRTSTERSQSRSAE